MEIIQLSTIIWELSFHELYMHSDIHHTKATAPGSPSDLETLPVSDRLMHKQCQDLTETLKHH